MTTDNFTLEEIINEAQLQSRIEAIASEIATAFRGQELIAVGLLKGSFVFLADIARLLHKNDIPVIIDFMITSSYGSGTQSSGTVEMSRDITTDITNRHVLLIDDILDTGRTLAFVNQHLLKKNPLSVTTCVFLDKPDRRAVPFQADYVGFTVPDTFVVGYGLDYDSRFRELPHISRVSFTPLDE